MAQTQRVYDAQQPRLNGLADTAGQAFSARAPTAFQTSPFVQQAQDAAGQTLGGRYLNQNPGAATYARVGAAENPATSTLQGLASQNGNPAYAALAGMSGSNQNPAYGALSALAQGSASPGNYSGIGAGDPSLGAWQALQNGGTNSAIPGLTSQAYSTGTLGAGDGTLGRIAAGGSTNRADGYDASVLGGKYLNANPGASMYADTLAGKYLDSNPYVDAIAKQGEDAALKSANQRFGMAGLGTGLSSAYTDVATRNVADAGNTIRFENYNTERGRQLQAGSQADAAFANERGNMETASGRISTNYNAGQDRSLSAAQALSAGSRADAGTRLSALGQLSAADQQQFANRATAASGLGSAYASQQGLQLSGQQARDNAFQADRSAQLGAAQGLGSLYNQGADRQLSAAQGLGSLYNQGQQTQLGAASALGSQWNQGQQTQLAAGQAQDAAYGDERSRMMQALGMTNQLTDAQYAGIDPMLNLGRFAATVPFGGTGIYNEGVNGLTNGYGTTTATQSQSFGSVLGGLAGAGISAWAGGGFKGV